MIQVSFPKLLPEGLPGFLVDFVFGFPLLQKVCVFLGKRGDQDVQYFIFHGLLGLDLYFFFFSGFHHVDALFHQVTHHAFHIPAHVAHLGKFGSFHFGERGFGYFGQPAGYFCFTHSRRADHQDIIGNDLLLYFGGGVHPSPAIPEGDGYIFFGIRLSDDVFVQLSHNLTRSKIFYFLCHVTF
ncbi:hypothetical protein FQZ97_1079290 [compost metagenome]